MERSFTDKKPTRNRHGTDPITNHEASTRPDLITVPEAPPEKKQKTKPRKKKFKPTLVTRLKLDADGEMVPDDTPEEDPVLEKVAILTVNENEPAEEIIPVTATSSQPAEEFDEDDESFKSLDTEKSFTDEAERDGGAPEEVTQSIVNENEQVEETTTSSQPAEDAPLDSLDTIEGGDVFEIHGTDPVTPEMSDKSMELPSRMPKSTIEKILGEGDLAINAADNVLLPLEAKQNLGLSGEVSGATKKKQFKRRVKVEENAECSSGSTATKKPRKSRKNEAAVTEAGQELESEQSNLPPCSLKVVQRPEPALKKEETIEAPQVISSYQIDDDVSIGFLLNFGKTLSFLSTNLASNSI